MQKWNDQIGQARLKGPLCDSGRRLGLHYQVLVLRHVVQYVGIGMEVVVLVAVVHMWRELLQVMCLVDCLVVHPCFGNVDRWWYW